MTQEVVERDLRIDDWVGLPKVETKFDIPADFHIETPKFKKTSRMGRVEAECNDVIERIIGWKCLVEGKTDAKIGEEIGTHKGTVRDWRRKIGIYKPLSNYILPTK